MKKLTSVSLVAILISLCLNSCALDYEYSEDDLKNEYLRYWIKTYGLIDPDQDWNMATTITASIDPTAVDNGSSLYIYSAHPLMGGVLLARVSSPGDFSLDVVKGTSSLYIRQFNADFSSYRDRTVDVTNGTATIRSAASRVDTGNDFGDWVTVSGSDIVGAGTSSYHWIIACEDLGSTGDVDFNDIVLGMTYVAGTNPTLTITPLACGGTLEAYVSFNGTPLFEIHQRFGVETKTMHNTYSWYGPAEAVTLSGSDLNGYSVTNKMGGISITVKRAEGDRLAQTIISPSENGLAPAMICVPGNWEWPSECKSIQSAYPGFTDWSQDKTLTEWMNNKEADKVISRPNERTNTLTQRTLNIDGTDRTYLLYVPTTVSANPALVMSLHGANNHSQDFMPFKTEYAETAGCIVAYPQGAGQNFPIFGSNPVPGWDADAGPDGQYVLKNTADEKFLRAILKDIAKSYKYDSKRVYCCGFSNGGMMTYAASVVMSDVFAAFASCSGFPVNEFHHYTWGPRPVPFLHIHGKNDNMVNYNLLPMIRDCMVARNGCNPVPQTTEVSGKYIKKVYKGISGRTFDYTTIEVDGLGHYYASENLENYNTSKVLWEFFNNYTLDSPYDSNFAWGLNFDANGFDPQNQGWDIAVNSAKTYYTFGHTDYNQYSTRNAYPAVQFATGTYKVTFNSSGTSGNKLYLKLTGLTNDSNVKLCGYTTIGSGEATAYFTIYTYAEYKLDYVKENASDKLTSLEITRCDASGSNTNFTGINPSDFPTDGHLVEVAQQYPSGESLAYCDHTTTDGVTTYTTNATYNLAFKMTNIDVTDCDYILIKFAEAVPSGWSVGFWSGQSNVSVPAGSTEYRIDIPTDNGEESMLNASGQLNQICLLRLYWGEGDAPVIQAKVEGVYLHCTRTDSHTH